MSSYIVTTKRPRTRQAWPDKPSYALSRRAVATLEEASALVTEVAGEPGFRAMYLAGGSLGPLPDGTVIEVEWQA